MMSENLKNAIKKFEYLKHQVKNVQILLVTKGVNEDFLIDFIRETKHFYYGENYVNEFKKWDKIITEFPQINLSFIGKFQSGNLRNIVKYCNKIETIGSLISLEKAKKEAQKRGKNLKYYAQINIGNEPQKNGFLEKSLNYEELKVFDGIMCIPPKKENPSLYFKKMADISTKTGVKEISMGMSTNYEVAISFGATEVRIGSLIFEKNLDII
jgi:uncharacterized pyridoxal phosphate-containing UPF0001 family protein